MLFNEWLMAYLVQIAGSLSKTETFKEIRAVLEEQRIKLILERIQAQKSKHRELVEQLAEYRILFNVELTSR